MFTERQKQIGAYITAAVMTVVTLYVLLYSAS
jgi:hypothetical protein